MTAVAPGAGLGRHADAPIPQPVTLDQVMGAPTGRRAPKWLRVLLLVLAVVCLPLLVVLSPLLLLVFRGRPALEWLERNRTDPGPHSFWGSPKPKAVWDIIKEHGCYYMHGPLGSGKTMGSLVLGLLMAWKQAGLHDEDQYLFVNFTVDQYKCRLFLVRLGCPLHVVNRIVIEQFSVMDQREATHLHVWRRRFAVIVADELPYYMEEDKKTIKSLLLRAFRMARRRKQIVFGIGQELIHSRYRPLFRLRGQCGMNLGLMRIVWRGAQDVVDAKKPTKPQAVSRYGLDVKRIGAMYDSWEDLEDLDDDAAPMSAPTRITRRSA